MIVAVLNVRPSRQASLEVVRVDIRNRDVALDSIGEEVIFYAPSDEPRHGYFGTGRIVDVSPDFRQRRFMFILLKDICLFERHLAEDDLPRPIENLAYRPDGSIDFGYFSPGIRALSPHDQVAAEELRKLGHIPAASTRDMPGLETPFNQTFSGGPATAMTRGRETRTFVARDRRLRWLVLEAYGPACAVCGDADAVHERGVYEVEVCHLHALEKGGPDTLTNAMPMCRKHHWAFDWGLFTLAPAGNIIASTRMETGLRRRFNKRTRASFPKDVQAWPKAEHLQFHQDHVFLK